MRSKHRRSDKNGGIEAMKKKPDDEAKAYSEYRKNIETYREEYFKKLSK